jgi:hypothetical protein
MVLDMRADADRTCIQVKWFRDQLKFLTVDDYEHAQHFARHLSPRGRGFHGVGWALDCPPVERLTREWQEVDGVKYRIVDREAYDVQMRQLLGIL